MSDYLEALERLRANGETPEKGSPQEQEGLDAVRRALSDFKHPDFPDRIRAAYGEEIFFNDTLKTLRRRDELVEYMKESASQLEAGTVEFLSTIRDGDDHYLRWRMSLTFKKLADGKPTHSCGMSHLRFDGDGKVVLHQDFWDSTGGFFEHLPVVGWMITRVKKRL